MCFSGPLQGVLASGPFSLSFLWHRLQGKLHMPSNCCCILVAVSVFFGVAGAKVNWQRGFSLARWLGPFSIPVSVHPLAWKVTKSLEQSLGLYSPELRQDPWDDRSFEV